MEKLSTCHDPFQHRIKTEAVGGKLVADLLNQDLIGERYAAP